jgi:tRNA (mo5U34)-methyltransferase
MKGADHERIRAQIQTVPIWWHSIELSDGIVTPGYKTPALLQNELASLRLPDLTGKSVLDIGAWDGFYSFTAERRGAASVVALDHYIWCMDIAALHAYGADCKKRGVVPAQYDTVPELWRPAELPGKRGFDVAHDALGSRVKPVVADFTSMDLDQLGTFDVSLYLGVLYHMHDPFRCLKRLARVTRELAVIETSAIRIPGYERSKLWEFYETDELEGDVNNWWAPSEAALLAMCRAAGFSRAESLSAPPGHGSISEALIDAVRSRVGVGSRKPIRYRLVVHAWK